MALDFSGIVKKRVPFVPYVQTTAIKEKPKASTAVTVGHDAPAPLSTASTNRHIGQAGQAGTPVDLKDMCRLSNCSNIDIYDFGHAGHPGHHIENEDVEFFNERAGIVEFEGQLCRTDAEAQAFSEWQVWRTKRRYH